MVVIIGIIVFIDHCSTFLNTRLASILLFNVLHDRIVLKTDQTYTIVALKGLTNTSRNRSHRCSEEFAYSIDEKSTKTRARCDEKKQLCVRVFVEWRKGKTIGIECRSVFKARRRINIPSRPGEKKRV